MKFSCRTTRHRFRAGMVNMLAGLFACLLAGLLTSTAAYAEHSGTHHIDKVKAAIVLKIVRFVTWPEHSIVDHYAPMVLCYYRSNPFPDALSSIEGKSVSGRKLVTRQVSDMSAAKGCRIMLVPMTELEDFNHAGSVIRQSGMLTLTDRTGARPDATRRAAPGIMVTLVRNGTRIGFEIDIGASKEAGLKISSELLKHARIVGGGS